MPRALEARGCTQLEDFVIRSCRALVWMMALLAVPGAAHGAQRGGTLAGTVVDSLGAVVPGATVMLLRGEEPAGQAVSGTDGAFSFGDLPSGRYVVRARLAGFVDAVTGPVFVAAGARVALDVVLDVGPFEQQVVVTASAAEVLQARTGAPVTVVDATTLDALASRDLAGSLRLVPGTQVVQVGQRGGGTSVFLRGGNSSFTKVLLDGVPANDIGGAFDFSRLGTTGVERVEVLRQANSVTHGSDALAGVINVTTRRGRSRIPELEYVVDGGNLATVRNAVSGGGAVQRVDYFSQYEYETTDNDVPGSGFTRGTYAGRFGVAVGGGTLLSATVRRLDTELGDSGGFDLYGIANDSGSEAAQTYVSVTADSQIGARWQTSQRFGSVDQTSAFTNPTPTGEPFDPFGFGPNYLGDTVTLRGANGTSVTGRAILDFGGLYPSVFESRTTRRTVAGQGTFQASPALAVSAGGRIEREEAFADPDADPSAHRTNGGAFVEGRAAVGRRAFVSAGVGVEHNEAFRTAYTPRLSVAAYLREPSTGAVGDTKLTFNVGRGIKAPGVFQEENSLYVLLQPLPGLPGVEPIGPERSRSVDIGVEQALAGGRVRTRVAYFDNAFQDLLEFLGETQLVRAGVSPAVAQAASFAYVNSSSYSARGLEVSAEARLGTVARLSGSYTLLDAEVTDAFGAGAVFNPAFPDVPIGAFAPLVGERPFRRPTHAGMFLFSYARGPLAVALAAYLSGASDDSTFLSDAFFGNSLLLPNQDLDPAYQKLDLSGSYRVHRHLRVHVAVENLLDQDYAAAYGYPSLPITVRAGASVTLGGR
jgi:iron complex outermembrane receptor protein/vitamin B12 transporter